MKKFKNFKEDNHICKSGEYYCRTDQKCKPIPSGYKVDDNGMLVKEDAPANAVGTGVNVSLPPAVEPGVLPKKKKKKGIVMGFISRKIKENNDNNNVILKQILDGLDKVDTAIDTLNQKKEEVKLVETKSKKSFREKYHLGNDRKKNV